jgi:hypothetical protein
VTTNLENLVERLRANPGVLGLIQYGGRTSQDETEGGDFDLLAIVRSRDPNLESIHFYWGEMPVDLNLRTLQDLKRKEPLSHIDRDMAQGELLFDRLGSLLDALNSAKTRWEDPEQRLPEAKTNLQRFSQQHALDKVRGRLNTDPRFCELLLWTNIHWLIATYFEVRRMEFPGERAALERLKKQEPRVSTLLSGFFDSEDLEEKLRLSEELTEIVLAPVGSPWRKGEVIALGVDNKAEGLKTKSNEAFSALLSTDPQKAAGGPDA